MLPMFGLPYKRSTVIIKAMLTYRIYIKLILLKEFENSGAKE
jgi:hypothetical protein